ncbi:unannotated protein [freshwater metagenome]|uniref:Unannotated protein n=1 Tax=freshwater metagenome TaxID=449393 RepID=A0A6J6XFE4_9ZZZZ
MWGNLVESAHTGGVIGPEEKRIEVADGVSLRTLHWAPVDPGEADRPAFLLVHGLASNARLWDGVASQLANAGFRAISVDLRGHGQSDKPDHGYDFATITNDLLAVIEHEGLDRPVVAGQSWGGNVVIELAWSAPERVRGVCAVDGGMIELGTHMPSWNACADALRPPDLVGMRTSRMEGFIRSAHPNWPEAGIQGAMANFHQRDDGTIAPWLTLDRHMKILRSLWEHRPTSLYEEIVVPVMLAPADTGQNPSWTSDKREAIEIAERLLPVSRTHWFAPADHDLHAQHPDRLAQHLIDAVADGFFSPYTEDN